MAEKFKACLVGGCGGNAHWTKSGARGYCQNHYIRVLKHGDPLAGRAAKGEPLRFYEDVVLKYDGADCLIWPFARKGAGYARLLVDGKLRLVTRLVCEEEHGPPPTPDQQAAHSCGNGDKGCVTKRHLSWKTPAGNSADRLEHGTDNRGEKHGQSKLHEAAVREIIALKGVEPQSVTAKRYGIRQATISMIQTRRAWAWLEV